MDGRERVLRVLRGEYPDRVPMDDSYWTTTVERWRQEGMPADVDPHSFFGANDICRLSGDCSLQMPVRVEEELPGDRTYWDAEGAFRRDLHTAEGWTSQWLDFSIKTPDDWARVRSQMAFDESRVPETALERYQQARARGQFVCYVAHASFHPTWMRLGMERTLVLLLDQAEWMHEMMAAHARLVCDVYRGMCRRGIVFDGVLMADDLGYQAAPLVSPKLYQDVIQPHHASLAAFFAREGLPTLLHSDGNVGPLIPGFLEAGFCGLNPLEVKAGLDVRTLQPQYGERCVWFGNIDARVLARSREEIEEEISTKLAAVMPRGNFIYHSDHSVPNDVSLENYIFACDLVRRLGRYD